MPTPEPFTIQSLPGIKRDGTSFEGDNYNDGLWCRFTARGLPRKIGGYQAVTSHLPEVVRGMDIFSSNQVNYLHLGSKSYLTQVQVGVSGSLGTQVDRTPGGFTIHPDNLWQLAAFYNKINGKTSIIAHAGQNLSGLSNTTETPIYYGDIDSPAALSASLMDPVSGGVLALPPYLAAFSNSGRIDVSAVNDPTAVTAGSVFATAQKIVRGLSIRGSGGPAALLWSLDSLVSMIFNPSILTGIPFSFNELSTSISVLSEQGIIEFDSTYYWVGVDRFQLFNGIVQELPNNLNIDFFFKNLNFTHRQKVFAFKVPRWGEIWWCFPFGNSTECNHAVIYNTRLKTWYDTPLPDGGRSAAIWAKVYPRPFMCDLDITGTGYSLWQHEIGVDKILGSQTLPIKSFYETHEMSPITLPQGAVDKAFRVSIIESDFDQVGALTCTVIGRANARVNPTDLVTIPITQPPASTADQVGEVKQNARLLSFRFTSNTPGGDYTAGKIIGHIEPTDGRITQ